MDTMDLIVWMSAVNTAWVPENVTSKQDSVMVAVKLDGRNQHVKQVRDTTIMIKNSDNSNEKVYRIFLMYQ